MLGKYTVAVTVSATSKYIVILSEVLFPICTINSAGNAVHTYLPRFVSHKTTEREQHKSCNFAGYVRSERLIHCEKQPTDKSHFYYLRASKIFEDLKHGTSGTPQVLVHSMLPIICSPN